MATPGAAAQVMIGLLATAALAWAGAGDLDPSFGSGGAVVSALSPGEDVANVVAIQPDGRIVLGGRTNGGPLHDARRARPDLRCTADICDAGGGCATPAGARRASEAHGSRSTTTRTTGGTRAGKPCWHHHGRSGFRYRNREGGPGGTTHLLATAGVDGRTRAVAKGKGLALALPALPLVLPARVQLVADSGLCVESVFSTALRNDAGRVKAVSDP
jgi:hypothetical protein